MTKGCTPHNVGGKLLGMMEATGVDIEKGTVETLDISGQSYYHNTANRAGNDIDVETPTSASVKVKSTWEHLDDKILGGGVQLIGRVLTDQRNPSGILGDEIVGKVSRFLTDHYSETYSKISNEQAFRVAKKEYDAGIKKVFAGIGMDGMTEAQKGYFLQYKRFYERQGGELYAASDITGAGQAFTNLVTNQIQNSSTVLLGNPLEVAIKLPALYDVHALPGLAEWVKRGGMFKKLPELESSGAYGFERLQDAPKNVWEKLNQRWDGLISVTDIPTKNLAYLTGVAKGGHEEGLKAIQDSLFFMRLGDMPRQRWASGGRGETRLVSYTINTLKLHGGLWSLLLSPKSTLTNRLKSAKSLAIMYGTTGLIGGVGAMLPEPLEKAAIAINPELEDFFQENKTPFAKLVQAQGVGRLGVAFDIGRRKLQKTEKYLTSAAESMQSGDWNGFVMDGGLAVVTGALSFTKSPLGDAQLQKALYLGRDIVKDEMDGDLQEEIVNDFLPALKQN